MIVSLPDELIMALADGELDPPLAMRVRDAVRNDAAIRQKHEVFRSTRSMLSRSFNAVLKEPVPERLKRAVRNKLPRRTPSA